MQDLLKEKKPSVIQLSDLARTWQVKKNRKDKMKSTFFIRDRYRIITREQGVLYVPQCRELRQMLICLTHREHRIWGILTCVSPFKQSRQPYTLIHIVKLSSGSRNNVKSLKHREISSISKLITIWCQK